MFFFTSVLLLLKLSSSRILIAHIEENAKEILPNGASSDYNNNRQMKLENETFTIPRGRRDGPSRRKYGTPRRMSLGGGPRRFGGLCGQDRDNMKECFGKCVPRSELCDGSCLANQCIKESNRSCVEMFVDGDPYSKMLFKECDGYCIPASTKCGDDCHTTQCWEPGSRKCLNPTLDRTEKQIDNGIFTWRNCEGVCKSSFQKCNKTCGDPAVFCWDQKHRKCLSLQELQLGERIRSECEGSCIPFEEKCNGVCGVGQCEQEGKCINSLELNEKYRRIRKPCYGKCIQWDEACGV